jgi:hypothetical protein
LSKLSRNKKLNKEFDKILLDVIDNSFKHIGKSMGQVVYYHLEKDFIRKNKIPANTRNFSACLEMMFGKGGASLIELMIIERLYIKIEEELEERNDYDFTECVDVARKRYLKKKQ